ncbi:MAG: hypothetical protein JJ863_11515 [Deltaproteobacteria bacterium]|nr:hypothetical protein [Deltaproteobacteria bacterium]
MSVFDKLSVAAAEATWHAAGPRAGLRAFRTIVDRVSASERARAILFGLDCATELGDRRGLDGMIARWRVQSGGDHFAAVSRRCLALRAVSMPHALKLAEVETARRPDDARAHYLLGRLRGDDGRSALQAALRLAERAPRQPGLASAARDRLTWLGDAPEGFDTGDRGASARLGKARADLRRGGRYARVAALDVLHELAAGPARSRALAIAAAHAERATPTEIELDRLRTIFGTHLAPPERGAVLGWLDARAALDAGEPPPIGAVASVDDGVRAARNALELGTVAEDGPRGAALAVIAAASEGLDALADAARTLASLSAEIPTAAEPYLAAAALAVRADPTAGQQIVERLFELPPRARRGWLRLGRALRDPELRTRALERARDIGEKGAEDALGQAARAAAWKAFAAGDERGASNALERARALLR